MTNDADAEQVDFNHPEIDPRQLDFDQIRSYYPAVDGVKCVVVSSGSRTCFHKQDPLAGEISPNCGTSLGADHTEWTLKPWEAMKRSSTTACPDCFQEGDDAA